MRILLVVHGVPPAASGGTEVYVRDLARALVSPSEDEVTVFTRDNDPHRPELSVRVTTDGPVRAVRVNNTFQACHSFEESYANPAIERIAAALLDDWRPDVAHVQHLTCLSTGIPRQAALRRIPVVVTLNDYWLICHRGQLVDLDGRRCDGPGSDGCARCLPPGVLAGAAAFRAGRILRSMPLPGASAVVRLVEHAAGALTSGDRTRAATLARLRHMQAAVRDVDLFLAPSDTLATAFAEFGIPADRLLRCNQGIALTPRERGQRPPSSRLRIGFAGGFQPTKGPDILLDAIDRLAPGSVSVDLLGAGGAYHGDDRFAESLASRLGHPAIRRLGPVPHERMPAVFDDLDVLVVPSTWIENAPFIIREAFAAGVPVITSDLGGMAEMVRDGVNGFLFPAGDALALAAILRRLADDRALLDALRAGTVRPMSIEADAEWLRGIYARLASAKSAQGVTFRLTAFAKATASPPELQRRRKAWTGRTAQETTGREASIGAKLSAVVLNYRTAEQAWLAVRSLQTSQPPPSEILIVDNASGDGSAERLRGSLEGVRILESPHNAGFSGGCNIGIRAALGRGAGLVLLVNSDAVLAPGALDHLSAALRRDPRLGIAAPVLLSREEPDHVSSAGISFSTRTGRMRHRGAGRRVAALDPGPVHTVDAVSGCVMLIRREVFERIGFLDEAYFFSFEDIDFCLRARNAGFQTGCVQDAVAYHEGGRTIGRRSARRIYFGTRNHLRLAARAGAPAGRPLRMGLVVALNAAYVLMSPEAPLVRGASALVRGAWHHFTGRYGPG
jgi:GT2 family glycosyltransferase/glycosyltransferase involved in cell wall biosynthesis